MPTANPLVPSDELEIVRLYGAGLSAAKIWKRFHIDASRFYGVLAAHGVKKRSRGDTIRTRLTTQQKTELVAAYRAGVSLEQLRITYKTARRVIKRLIIEAGLPITGQGRKPGKDRKILVMEGVEMLRCPKCGQMKKRGAFNKCTRARCGASSYCKECQTMYSKGQNYGITSEQYQALLTTQNGKCEMCGSSGWPGRRSPLSIDHNHTTGQIRGLLCHHCNSLLGHSRENPVILQGAINYLAKYSQGMVQ